MFQNPTVTDLPLEHHILCPFLNPGVGLDLVDTNPSGLPSNPGIRVHTRTHDFLLKSLDQLTGLVHINNTQNALQFVRLRTSRAYAYVYVPPVLEIISTSQALQPAFKWPDNDQGLPPAEWEGVLPNRDYQSLGFTPPVVRRTPDGYQIERWICRCDWERYGEGQTVERWRETIGPTGQYRRQILESKPAPKSEGIALAVPLQM
jgi:hypothetical protein